MWKFFLYRFGEMWLYNGLGNEDVFLKIFRKRLNDRTYPIWNNQIQTHTSVFLYSIQETVIL